MSILRFSTLSLTLAIAVFALGYVNSSSAGKPGACNEVPPHPSCKDDPVTSITYKVALEGAFEFGVPVPLDVVLEGQDNLLRSSLPVTIVRPTAGPLQDTWDDVFDFCSPSLLNALPIGAFMALAGKKGWTIDRPGGVGVGFRNIGTFSSSFPGDVDVTLSLGDDCDYAGGDTPCAPFLPDAGETSRIPLTIYRIHARGLPGLNSECHGETGPLPPMSSTLVITAPD